MAAKANETTGVEKIREVIRLLKLTLDDCNKLLVKESIQLSGQENEPRLKRPSA